VRYLRSQVEVVRNSGQTDQGAGRSLDFTEQRHPRPRCARRRGPARPDAPPGAGRGCRAQDRASCTIASAALSALNINPTSCAERYAAPAAKQRLADSINLVDSTLQSIEGVMAELRPPLLDEYGLAAALAWHAEEFSRRTGIKVSVDDEAAEAVRSLRLEAALALFRIAQEALNNVLKHAHAAAVRMEVIRRNDVVLSVQDDGAGFDASQAPRGSWE
jgi:hypothetical protein